MLPTGSLTVFRDSIAELITIFCQYDGYPSGYGRDLAEMVTVGGDDLGALAVEIVSQLHNQSDGLRIMPCGSSVGWHGYMYIVEYSCEYGVSIRIEFEGTVLFDGTASDCLEFCSNQC